VAQRPARGTEEASEATPKCYAGGLGAIRYPTEDERIHIADRFREKATVRAIAAELGRSPSTVSREIRRIGMPLPGDRSGR